MKMIVHGASGRMGQNLLRLIQKSGKHQTAAGVSPEWDTCAERLEFHTLPEFQGEADLILDFSHHTAIGDVLDYAIARNLPVVIGTTGHTEEEKARIAAASEKIPVFHAGNFSLGIALLMQLAKQTAQMFPDADIEIIEAHHNQKLDVPSGTALMLADAIKSVRPQSTYNVGRHENGKRTPEEIGMHSLRMGNVTGMHEIIVHTGTQSISLKHEAYDRALFAEGALVAADYLINQPAGLYDMKDMLN